MGNFAPETNFVNNGDFSTAWTSGIPTGWASDAVSNLTITQGNDSIVVSNPTATTKLYQDIEVVAGITYTLSYEYKATHARFRIWSGFSETAGGSLTYLESNSSNDELRTNNGYFPIASAFTKKSHTFTIPDGQSFLRLEFRYYSQAGGTFGLRNVKLIQQ